MPPKILRFDFYLPDPGASNRRKFAIYEQPPYYDIQSTHFRTTKSPFLRYVAEMIQILQKTEGALFRVKPGRLFCL